jgi:Subtilase family
MANGEGAGRAAQAREISEIQTRYILRNLQGAAVYPPRPTGQEGPDPVEFIYRRRHLLTRDRDLRAVLSVLRPGPLVAGRSIGRGEIGAVTFPAPGLALIEVAGGPDDPIEEAQMVFGALETVNQRLGPHTASVDHVVHVTPPPPPAANCPATEPEVPDDNAPEPAISRSRCDGRGTLVIVADTGLVQDAPASHPWLRGVTGDPDLEVITGPNPIQTRIVPYGGHGTFIASIIRAMAPRADVRVVRAVGKPGASYETCIVATLLPLLDLAPDVISLSAGTHTWLDGGLLSFKVFTEGPLRECEGTVLVAAAGNDGADWKFSPADLDPVIGVGALGPPGDARAWFSDFGDWVKVYAPGQDLVHAFASGQYTYVETNIGQKANFTGMARWSGTSFSTPVVSGLIAARMSGTGESSREAAESLLRLARAQALPGVGPVLHPGQACLCACERPCREPRAGCGCRPVPDR